MKALADRIKRGDISWPRDRDELRGIQELLSSVIRTYAPDRIPDRIAGVDAAFFDDRIISTACLYSYPELTLLEENYAIRKVEFPYIPGLLSFREGPAVMEVIEGLKARPQLVIFDGQGIAHPRGLGIASFVGALLDIPTIGSAKTKLVGDYKEPGKKRGSWSPLKYKNRIVGAVLRTKDDTKPLFISPGHMIDIESSVEIALGSTKGFRLTEPVRRADILSKEIKRGIREI